MTDPLKRPMADAVRAAYARDEEDEAMLPIVLADEAGEPVGRVKDGDAVIFYNIRGERESELSMALTDPAFPHFDRHGGFGAEMSTMIQYSPDLPVQVAFPPLGELQDSLCEVVSKAGRRLAKIVETEKAIHVNFFLNGKRNEVFAGEERVPIETDRTVDHFDAKPEMSVQNVADATIEKLADPSCDLIITNFANIDVVGHIENKDAVHKAIAAVDEQLGRVLAAAREAGVVTLVTADHGTTEKWYYPEGAIDTGHTDSPVPFAIVGAGDVTVREGGGLADVAPTILTTMGLDVPEAMTGECLVSGLDGSRNRVFLMIVDGWGIQPAGEENLISQTDTPNMDALLADNPSTTVVASGEAVGMPEGTVGNSEAGHLHIGAGRVVPSDRMRIQRAIDDESFYANQAFVSVAERAKADGAALHLLGIISFYSSHGSVDYLIALLETCRRLEIPEVYVHGLLGRRGERPEAGARYIGDMEAECEKRGVGTVVSVIGRHWALDREEHWDRVQKCYDMMVYGDGTRVKRS